MYSMYVHHTCLVFPAISVLCQSDRFVITDESTMAHHYYPKSIAYFRIHSRCCKFQQVFGQVYSDLWASLVAQTKAKNQPAMQETWIQSLGQEDPPEKRMATHSGVLSWRTPGTEEPDSYSPWGHKESDTTEWLTNTLIVICIYCYDIIQSIFTALTMLGALTSHLSPTLDIHWLFYCL